jgi:beta-galactosidase
MMGTETHPNKALENWTLVKKLPYVIGYFVWTATDNLGEAGVGLAQLRDIVTTPPAANAPAQGGGGGGFFRADSWPVYTNYQGDLDLIGTRKSPSFYQYVVWGTSKVEVLVHRPIPEGKREMVSPWGFPDELKSWNWSGREGEKFQVHVYTRCQQVKLELNGKIVGEQNVDQEKSITATFDVPYEPGTLIARCYDNGKETASQTLKTTGKPAAIRLVADRSSIRADRNDLSYIMTEIIDANGNIVPDADDIMVNFEVKGNGKIAGVGNGNPRDMSSFQQPVKKAYQGICLAIVRPEATPGKISVRATAGGLKEASLVITVR